MRAGYADVEGDKERSGAERKRQGERRGISGRKGKRFRGHLFDLGAAEAFGGTADSPPAVKVWLTEINSRTVVAVS